jgi:hypothetical protein
MREFIKNPYAERIKKNGCMIRVTRGEGSDKVIVEERIITYALIIVYCFVIEVMKKLG